MLLVLRRFRRVRGRQPLALVIVLAMLTGVAVQAVPAAASASALDPGMAERKTTVGHVGTWTAGLANAGKMAEPVPPVGSSVGSVLGLPDLVRTVRWVDALTQRLREGGRTVLVHALIAVGVNADGQREVLGLDVVSGRTARLVGVPARWSPAG